jgi:hypothetical protein
MSGECHMRIPLLNAILHGVLAALLIAAPAQTALAKQESVQKPQTAIGGGLAELVCANGGREAPLTASRVSNGDRHYIEFRTRNYPGSPSGHLYVVFGELDDSGKVLSRFHIGLAPDWLAIGFIGGAVVSVPAHLTPRRMECNGGVIDAWRLSISPAQYAAVTRKARSSLLNPPLWSMFGFNCNHFAAEFGDIIGLKHPQSRNLMARLYLPAYIKANSR